MVNEHGPNWARISVFCSNNLIIVFRKFTRTGHSEWLHLCTRKPAQSVKNLVNFSFKRALQTVLLSSVKPRSIRRMVIIISVFLWLSATCLGLGLLWGYENAPGLVTAAPPVWPSSSRIQPAPDHPTLVMLAHPHCPCTRASVGELSVIMAHSQGRLTAYVLFLKPEGFADAWEQTELWQSASRIPGVKMMIDGDGREARLFHAATSGQTVLYDSQGRLLFSGGITASRGHSGDNAGRSAIVSLLNAEVPDRTETLVFGCPLFNPKSDCRVLEDEIQKR